MEYFLYSWVIQYYNSSLRYYKACDLCRKVQPSPVCHFTNGFFSPRKYVVTVSTKIIYCCWYLKAVFLSQKCVFFILLHNHTLLKYAFTFYLIFYFCTRNNQIVIIIFFLASLNPWLLEYKLPCINHKTINLMQARTSAVS